MDTKNLPSYSDEDLLLFKDVINKKLSEAQNQFNLLQTQIAALAESPEAKANGLDDGISMGESKQLAEMAKRTQKHMQHLEFALLRIKNKTYGYCRETGKLISKERLMAVPHATLCIEAKQK